MPRMIAPGVLMISSAGRCTKEQDAVDHTVFFQKRLPCHGAEQEIHPHRKNENQHDKTGLIDILAA